jgi:hypothetical protein
MESLVRILSLARSMVFLSRSFTPSFVVVKAISISSVRRMSFLRVFSFSSSFSIASAMALIVVSLAHPVISFRYLAMNGIVFSSLKSFATASIVASGTPRIRIAQEVVIVVAAFVVVVKQRVLFLSSSSSSLSSSSPRRLGRFFVIIVIVVV